MRNPAGTGGNVHCISDPDEAVIGWVGCTNRNRIKGFLWNFTKEVPGSYPHGYPATCALDSIAYDSSVIAGILANPVRIPVGLLRDRFTNAITGITVSDAFCANCDLQEGVILKPVYWQE